MINKIKHIFLLSVVMSMGVHMLMGETRDLWINMIGDHGAWKVVDGLNRARIEKGEIALIAGPDNKVSRVRWQKNLSLSGRRFEYSVQFMSAKDGDAFTVNFDGVTLTGGEAPLTIRVTWGSSGLLTVGNEQVPFKLVVEDRSMPINLALEFKGAELSVAIAGETRLQVPVTFLQRGGMHLSASNGPIVVSRVMSKPLEGGDLSPAKSVSWNIELNPSDMTPVPAPWEEYIGTHYDTSPHPESWKNVRGFGGLIKIQPHEDREANKQIGPFSGEAYYFTLDDIRRNGRGSIPLSKLVPMAMEQDVRVIYGLFNGNRKRNDPFNPDVCYLSVKMIHTQFPEADEFIAYQLGNEVNEMHVFDPLGLRQKQKETGVNYGNSQEALEMYVEMVFAPAYVAVTLASEDAYGDPNRLFLVLGSVANIFDPDSVQWAEDLVDYRIKGTYAPSLGGKRVGDLIDALSVHYPLAGANGRELIQELYDKFVASGKVENLWFTEDHGRRGEGPVTILSRSFRYIDWIAQNQIPEGQTLLCWWGAEFEKVGGRPVDAILKLGNYTGVSQPLLEKRVEREGIEVYELLVGDVTEPKGILIGFVSGDIRLQLDELALELSDELKTWASRYAWEGEWTAYSTMKRPEEAEVEVSYRDGRLVVDLGETLPEAGLLWIEPRQD